MHEIDRREKPERHLTGGEGGKEGAACFCAEIASCSTSQRIKYIAAECERAPMYLLMADGYEPTDWLEL